MPNIFARFLFQRVQVKVKDYTVSGVLVSVNKSRSHNGTLGNLILETENGEVLIRGSAVIAVGILTGSFSLPTRQDPNSSQQPEGVSHEQLFSKS